MKKDTHPNYHMVTVTQTDGSSFQTRSTFGAEGDTINLDIDPKSHPAWSGGAAKVVEKGQLSKFENRFGTFLSSGSQKKKDSEEK